MFQDLPSPGHSPVQNTTSVITHTPIQPPAGHDSVLQRPATYSINGILGINHPDPNGNITKRKRTDEQGKCCQYIDEDLTFFYHSLSQKLQFTGRLGYIKQRVP